MRSKNKLYRVLFANGRVMYTKKGSMLSSLKDVISIRKCSNDILIKLNKELNQNEKSFY